MYYITILLSQNCALIRNTHARRICWCCWVLHRGDIIKHPNGMRSKETFGQTKIQIITSFIYIYMRYFSVFGIICSFYDDWMKNNGKLLVSAVFLSPFCQLHIFCLVFQSVVLSRKRFLHTSHIIAAFSMCVVHLCVMYLYIITVPLWTGQLCLSRSARARKENFSLRNKLCMS